MKYYFIAYQAMHKKSGLIQTWNTISNHSPMAFKMELDDMKDEYFGDYVVTMVFEISKSEYEKFNGQF